MAASQSQTLARKCMEYEQENIMGFTIDMKAHVVCDDYKFDRPSHSRMAELRDRIPRTLHHGLPEGLNLHHGLQPHTCSSAKLNRENSLYYTVKLTYTSHGFGNFRLHSPQKKKLQTSLFDTVFEFHFVYDTTVSFEG
jgi:hypothetical protein